ICSRIEANKGIKRVATHVTHVCLLCYALLAVTGLVLAGCVFSIGTLVQKGREFNGVHVSVGMAKPRFTPDPKLILIHNASDDKQPLRITVGTHRRVIKPEAPTIR